jgi:hypothetical protein
MKDPHRAPREFVAQQPRKSSPDTTAPGQQGEAQRNAGFEFARQLAAALSTGSFDLPPFPDSAPRVRDALSNPGIDIDTVARIVLSEPVLSARLAYRCRSSHRRVMGIPGIHG